MNDPVNTERLLALLAEEKKPELSPYFESRLHRAVTEEERHPRHARAVRFGALALMVFSVLLLSSLDYFRWLIPLMIFVCLPEDWADNIARRFRGLA